MKQNHTPGPYEILEEIGTKGNESFFRIRGTHLSCKFKIADVHYVNVGTAEMVEKAKAEAFANAKLLRASAEMFEDLQGLINNFEYIADDEARRFNAYKKAKDVIKSLK